ncbi:L2 protein [Human papillomavirus 179]|uniref:Minor capsid protein L2 n=1 Tax=Human papillomavirus 179 TaxID=1472342 RepID=S6FS07_9PAPI|nr:L2 protein [Human papillomavirus 179]CDG41972.1 L2 protein [Human papillomavirus 179]
MLRARRQKRASINDLYRNCRLGGDCPEDVKNKVEGTTLADRLLQIFGSILYFGNLGIGTGKGTGGFGGYKPIGGTASKGPEITVSRPNVPIDPLGGADVIPLDIINPEAPSVIPLQEGGLPNIPVTDTGITTTDIAEIDIITTTNPIDNPITTDTQPTVITQNNDIFIVDMQPGPPPPKRIALDVGTRPFADIELNVFREPHFDSNVNVFVDPNITGDVVGLEEIELGPLNEVAEFAIEEGAGPSTSTPTQSIERIINQGQRLYNRFVQQVQTRNPDFVTKPSRLVTFEFENPAFDDDVTLTFEQDINDVAAAPDYEFRDIVRLERPIFTTTDAGLRLSRLGQRGSITTRSGLTIGPRVHFYYDFSEILPEESIELSTFAIHSNEDVFIDPMAESSIVNSDIGRNPTFSDDYLEDIFTENFNNAHLVLTFGERDIIEVPISVPKAGINVFITGNSNTTVVDYTSIKETTIITPSTNLINLKPALGLYTLGEDFIFDPDLFRKRRKRKYSDV